MGTEARGSELHTATQPRPEVTSKYFAFVRDGYRCVYCGKDILSSFEEFSAVRLARVKPCLDHPSVETIWNRVVACNDCELIKGSFDPIPGEVVVEQNFEAAVSASREFVRSQRGGAALNDEAAQ